MENSRREAVVLWNDLFSDSNLWVLPMRNGHKEDGVSGGSGDVLNAIVQVYVHNIGVNVYNTLSPPNATNSKPRHAATRVVTAT